MIEQTSRNLRYAWRGLRRTPLFTAVAVGALAIGIGATSAVFSLVHAVLLKPLPYAQPDRLMLIGDGPGTGNVTPPDFQDWRREETGFSVMGAYAEVSHVLTGRGDPVRLVGLRVTAGVFAALGVPPLVGSLPGPDVDVAGGAREVVLSTSLWRTWFASDSAVIGRVVRLDSEDYLVRAVMPDAFRFPVGSDVSFWTSMGFTPSELANRGAHFLTVIGRLHASATPQSAGAAMRLVAARVRDANPQGNADSEIMLTPLAAAVVGDARQTLTLLSGAVALVLLIAVANVAGMQLVRAFGRRREIAVRAALGADARKIVSQLVTESLLLAALSGAAGLGIAAVGVRVLAATDPGGIARYHEIGIDPVVLAFVIGVAGVSGLIFGLAPSLLLWKTSVRDALGSGSRNTGAGTRYRAVLVAAEVAMAVVLLAGAGLLVRSLRNLVTTDPGFDPENAVAFNIDLPGGAYPSAESRASFFEQTLDRISVVPGVRAAGAISFLPMAFRGGSVGVTAEGAPPPADGEPATALFRVVTPRYFEAIGIRFREGRGFESRDGPNAPAAIVNEAMARQSWPDGGNPVGRRLKLGRAESTAPWITIVGVVRDVRQFEMREAARPEVFVPITQPHPGWVAPHAIVVRTQGDPTAVYPALRAAVRAVDPQLPVSNLRRVTEIVGATTAELRFYAVLLTLLSMTALVLAAVGTYGIISYSVSQRRREIGVRMAVGATSAAIMTMFMRQGLTLALAGLVVGLAGAFALTRYLASQLYGVTTTDPATLLATSLALLVTAFLACVAPARRAAAVDPLRSLNEE